MIKKRNWAAVIYPESAPSDWIERLQLKGLPFAISPLHDKDINPTGEVKKAHYHIIMCFPGPTTDKTVNDIIVKEFGQPIAIPLESIRGYYRYFTHKDNPEKHQYQASEIQLFNAFDVTDVINNFETFQIMKEIQMLIIEHDIVEYCDLLDLLLQSDKPELWNVASTHTMVFNSYVTSRRNKEDKSLTRS